MEKKEPVEQTFPLAPGYRRVVVTVYCRIEEPGIVRVVADVPEDWPDRCIANAVIEACESEQFCEVPESYGPGQADSFTVREIETVQSDEEPMIRVRSDDALNHSLWDLDGCKW